jgi:hypothetical protein
MEVSRTNQPVNLTRFVIKNSRGMTACTPLQLGVPFLAAQDRPRHEAAFAHQSI